MITLKNVEILLGDFALRNISFTVSPGSYHALMGKTGCGKTTVIETICGLRKVKSGAIFIDGKDVTLLKPSARGIGFVPQDTSLFSTMTIYEHLAFALTIRKFQKREIKKIVHEVAEMLFITHLLPRKPRGLSGGEKQRVALGRALSFKPSILCLDEPLSALDDETRRDIISLLGDIKTQTNVTALHVTHNLSDVSDLADKIILLREGGIETRDVNAAGQSEHGNNIINLT